MVITKAGHLGKLTLIILIIKEQLKLLVRGSEIDNICSVTTRPFPLSASKKCRSKGFNSQPVCHHCPVRKKCCIKLRPCTYKVVTAAVASCHILTATDVIEILLEFVFHPAFLSMLGL